MLSFIGFSWIPAMSEALPGVAVTQARRYFKRGSRATHTRFRTSFDEFFFLLSAAECPQN